MALSFLSGDAGTPSLKEVEARAYAIEAAKKIKLARMLKQESDASINSMFIGLDEISSPMQRESRTDTRQPKPQRGSRPNERSAPQPTPMNATPTPAPSQARASSTPKPSMMVTTMPQTQSRTALPKMTTKAKTETTVSKLTPELEKRINVSVQEAKEQAKEAAAAAQEAKEEAVKEEAEGPMSFLKGKNALIIGGVAVAAIAAFYFFKKK
jgi:cobalamin biosynthesis Mg chelatase CobN